MGIPAFPFCHVALRGRKPRPGYPEDPRTLGEHLLKRRLDLGLLQREVARRLGVSASSYLNWETGRLGPEARSWPAVVDFLGYDPSPAPVTLGQRIERARRREGLTQRQLAERLGLDPGTVAAWEAGMVVKPYRRMAEVFERYVEEN